MDIQQILLTTDLSEHARRAYGCAANLASKFDATLHLVHFAGAIPSLIPTASRETLLDTLEETIVDEANEHAAFEGIDVQPHLQHHRWSRIRQTTLERELGIDLVVMSPQGRTGVARILLGSFADRLVRHSSVPVLLYRQSESDVAAAFDRSLSPYELTHLDERVHLECDELGPGHAISELAKREGIDLIVMGTMARTGLTGALLGNTAEQVLDQIECSVLAVKPDGFISPVSLPKQ